MTAVEERRRVFWTRATVDQDTGCWLWARGRTPAGYGRTSNIVPGDGGYAHRAAYILVHGFPGNYQIDHLCRVPACINPAHLEAVTGRENARRGKNGVLRHLRRPAA